MTKTRPDLIVARDMSDFDFGPEIHIDSDSIEPGKSLTRAKIISVINAKGGVGKTTLAYHLGMALALWKGAKVLMIDLDFQCNLTWLFCREDKLYYQLDAHRSQTLFQFFWGYEPKKLMEMDATPFMLKSDISDKISLIPSHHHVVRLDSMMSRWTPAAYRYRVLLDLLRANPSLADYDYVLIDCAPGLTRLTLNALVASDSYLVPLGLDLLSLNGLLLTQKAFREYLAEVEKQSSSSFLIHHPQLLGVLFPRVRYTETNEPQEIFREVERRAKALFPGKVFDHHIRDDDAVLRAVAMKRPFFTLATARNSPLIGDFKRVIEEFVRRTRKSAAASSS